MSDRCPAELAAARHTAIVTQECQGAILGPGAVMAVLAEAARREAIPNSTDDLLRIWEQS